MMRTLRLLVLALLAAYPALVGYGGPNPFQVAPLRASGDNYVPGDWVSSTTISSKNEITVVIMASWCPYCARLLDELAANPAASSKIDMVLFFDDENGPAAAQGKYLAYPSKIAGRSLPYYFAKQSELDGLYRGFPTILGCTREGCTSKSRSDIGLR